jgi:hypothetical protein
VDLARREVSLAGETVTLSRKEYALLALLVRHAGRVVTQPQLLRELWGPTHQHDTHYLRILAAKLRQKLGDAQLHRAGLRPSQGWACASSMRGRRAGLDPPFACVKRRRVKTRPTRSYFRISTSLVSRRNSEPITNVIARDDDRIPQALVHVAARGDQREGDRRQEAAEPAVADVVRQRHRGVADARGEQFHQPRRDRPYTMVT